MLTVSVVFCTTASAGVYQRDTTKLQKDTLKFPIQDRRGDAFSNPNKNPFNLKDPVNIKDSIEYDPKTNQYYIVEKIGNKYYRKPTYLTFEEFMRLTSQKSEDDYFRQRADVLSALNRRRQKPKLAMNDNLFNRLFGNGKIDIRPQGNVDITAGYQGQNVQNPTLPESARRTGGLDFNMDANVNVVGNIGSKLRLPITYNTQATFDWMNQLKLEYTGGADDIVKKIEAGNTSFTTKSTLMASEQSLFGIKAQLQFGKLFLTGVLANQRSQSQSLAVQGGSATTTFQFKADDYDENRHFLLAQYFRSNYNKAMQKLPIVTSQVQILRMEVWVTNRNGTTTQARGIVGLMDLGESSPYNSNVHSQTSAPYPYNDANDEYRNIINDPASRSSSQVITKLNSLGLTQVQDYEQVFARKLNPTDYIYNPQVGFISLNQTLQPNDVLAVAYQYSYNGRIYQVGEFSQDVPPDTTLGNNPGAQKVLYLKLLKATSQRTTLPIWDLMMKNVYTLKTGTGSYLSNIQQAGFQLNLLYEEPSKGTKRYLPAGDKQGVPLLTILNLDRLNAHNDPQPDGVFDYLEGFTIVSSQARIIFPLLEPFGRDLDSLAFKNSQSIKNSYVFYQLYDTIKEVAKTFANVDRYYIGGVAKGQATSDLSLGAFNVPPGSVRVTAGGQTLRENIDYVVDYNLGSVKIINQAIINSGVPVNVQYENNASFGTQQRGFMGLRLDYMAINTPTKSLALGGTIERLNERPYFSKTNYNEDPIRNTMYGVDVSYRSQVPEITRLLNKLPFYSSKEMSSISAVGEAAYLKPGHPPQIGKGTSGTIYIDDFEGSTSSIDLRFPLTSWVLASTPQKNGLFPEGSLNDSLDYGFNRAKIAWYNIEPTLQDRSNPSNPVRNYENFADPRIASLTVQQLFPQQTPEFGQSQLITFDVAYYPTDKGPYNFDARPGSLGPDGKLLNPQKRWGGIMRAIDQTDFETSNVQYIEFWMQSPFITNPTSSGGQLYFDLGSVSEDVLKDGRRLFENGLNTPNIPAAVDETSVWGRVPANPIQVTNAFSNDASDRPYQDIGFDGLDDPGEQVKFQNYLSQLATTFGTGSPIYQRAFADPSGDDFLNYRDASYDQAQAGILGRYKNINSPQGNSPVATAGQQFVNAFTLYPDQEDLDHDNTLNELEEYFEYKVSLIPDSLKVGQNFITDQRTFTPSGGVQQTWYQFRIPITSYSQKVGSIPDFKSIRYIRMFLNGFSDSVVCRFAKFELIRDQWRNFNYKLDTTGQYIPIPLNGATTFNITAVNIEQNSTRTPIPYVIPPGIQRQQQLSTNNINILLNEQAMSLQICNLPLGESRGVFKNTNLDLRRYGKMDMFIHAEAAGPLGDGGLDDGDLYAIVRIGSDFINNFYEIRIPLKKTRFNSTLDTDIWPDSNSLNLDVDRLVQLKVHRNNAGSTGHYYIETDPTGRTYALFGNPNLGQIQAFFLGVENAKRPSVCTEVWFDELRLSDINDHGGYAATGRVDIKLADLGTMYVSGSIRTVGFGTIDQNINQRSLDKNTQFDAATSLELGKLLPRKAGLSIPFYASISKNVSTPEFDPYDLDIKLVDKVSAAPSDKRDSIKEQAVDATTITSFNFTNVRKNNITGKKLKLWSIENFDVSYSYTRFEHHSPIAEEDELINYKGGLGYNFAGIPKHWEPFKRLIKSKSPWFALVKDFNINPVPSVISFRADVNRQFGAYRSRNIDGPKGVLPETYNKFFTFDRMYTLRWDLTRSLNIDFTALNKAWVDEDSGRLDKAERKKMWSNFWKGGRNISYSQSANITYTLPTSKFPLVDWTSVRAGYGATYQWTTASLLAVNLGNTIQNTQKKDLTSEFNFTKLYSKWKLLRDLDPSTAPIKPPVSPNKKADTSKIKKQEEEIIEQHGLHGVTKAIAKLLTSLKNVTASYSENSASSIFGYTDSTRIFGMNLKSGQPGFGYVFGAQPDTAFVNRLGRKGLLTKDTTFNFQNQASFNQIINISAVLQPVRDLNVTISWNKTFGKNYSELYKDTISNGGFARLNPYSAGSFSVSFISVKTLFENFKPNEISSTFKTFQNNRAIISERLGKLNSYSGIQNPDGYYKGYGKYAQDVLIPAFIAAYSGQNPSKVSLVNQDNPTIRSNPFSGYLPKPNWRISYNGLSRIPGLDKIFSNFSISNAYTSTLSMNSFNSALNFQDPLGLRQPGFIDTLTGNFVPYFLVPNISISEQFSPLIDLDMQFVNQLQARLSYSKSRQLSLSLIDYQMSESKSTDLTIGIGWRKRGLPLPFGIKLKGKNGAPSGKLDNDLTIRLDFSLRDDATSNSYLDQNASLPVGGQRVMDIAPSVDYVINNRINLKFYYDRRSVSPKISSSPPITTTRAGIQIRISLAEMGNPVRPPK
ncbi:MAG: cell surface protein SprA [Bacteroidetes bacterium]|nr:cell surface protein SprA [Bacteroidota bacterium]